MRTIPQGMIDALTNTRTIGGYVKVWDNRLQFTAHEGPLHDINIIDNLFSYDACEFGNGFLRIASVNVSGTKKLYYQYVYSVGTTPWPAWQDSTIALAGSSKPGVHGGRVFYHASDGDVYYVDFTPADPGVGIGTPVKLWDSTVFVPTAFAPVSTTEYFLHWQFNLPGNSFNYGYVEYMTTGGTHYYWPGRIYGTDQYVRYFDAVRLNSVDYIYITDQEEKRTWEIKAVGNCWGVMQQVLPLDIVGDLSLFTLGGANVIDGKIFVTGVLKRENGAAMQIYMMGPDHYTFGRDLFIGTDGTVQRSVTYDSQTKDFPQVGGKMMVLGNKTWYLGPGVGYSADSTRMVGNTTQLNYQIDGVASIRMDGQADGPSGVSLEIPAVSSSAYMRPGSEVDFYATLGGTSAILGVFNIDTINLQYGEQGEIKAITARALATKNLDTWQSDSNFDYWSQTKVNTNPGLFTKLTITNGRWSLNQTHNAAQVDQLNVESILGSISKKSRASQVRAKFKRPTGDYDAYYGVALNYHYVPARTVVQMPWPVPPNYANNVHLGIFVLYGPTFHSGSPGIKVEIRQQDSTTVVQTFSVSFAADVWHWIHAEFSDGRVLVKWRLDSASTWTDASIPVYYTIDEGNPWGKSEEGHGAIIINNVTNQAETLGVESNDMVIPVTSNSVFTTPDTVIIDDEQITISGKSPNYTGLPTMTTMEGNTFAFAPHSNTNWINGVLWNYQFDGNSDQNICDTTSNKHIVRAIVAEGTITIRKVKFRVKKVGTPAQNLYVYLTTDSFDNASPPSAGAILATCSVAPGSVGTSYSYVEWTFATPQTVTAENYFFVLTNVASGAPVIDASNYYVVATDTNQVDDWGIIRAYGPSSWRTLDVAIPFYVIGDGIQGDGYEIYFNTADTSKARDYYDNMALVVTSGAGKHSVFQVTDYDHQAPAQWVPSQTYMPPDRWEDHVGDEDHGAWVDPDARRIFVSEDPKGILGTDSICKMYPSLIVNQRGANGTVATTHTPSTAKLYVMEYRNVSVQCAQYLEHSFDVDMTFAWLATEICRKAGALTVTTEKFESGSLVLTHGGWSIDNDVPNTERQAQNLIARFKIASGTEAGIAFHMTKSGANYSNGRIVTVTSTNVSLYDRDGPTLLERFTLSDNLGDWITISIQESTYSVWIGNKLVATFVDSEAIQGLYAGFVSNGNATLTLDWEELDTFIDNYILDMGKTGMQLLSALIGEKHIHFQDTQAGGIRFFRNRTTVNSTPFALISQSGIQNLETELVTRLRVEGAEVAEVYDTANMKTHGNLYASVNLREVNNLVDAQREANFMLSEINKKRSGDTFYGAADPRVELGDVIKITDPEGTRDIVVMSMQYILVQNETEALFDMQVGGYNA